MASIIRADAIQHWAGKAPSFSNERWLKRAPGAVRKRDRSSIYARDGVDLDRRLMAQWKGRIGLELDMLTDHVLGEVLKGDRVFADETSLPTLAPGAGRAKKAWLWAYARDDSTFGGSGPPMLAYRFEDSRSGDCVRRHLGRYRDILQVDGYAAYNKLVPKNSSNDGPRLAGC